MKALIFSDIHSDLKALDRLMDTEADYYFAAGDTVTWARGFEAVGKLLARRADKVYVLPGNHESENHIAAFCRNFGFHPFHGQILEIDGFHVAGLGYSNPTPFNTPGEYSEQEIAARLTPFAGLNPLVLICHCPPKQTPLDRVHEGLHAGSQSIRDFIETNQPKWFFCGHIHEAEGVKTQLNATHAVNVGKRGYLLDFATINS